MRSTTEVILKQLANEGLKHDKCFGMHVLVLSAVKAGNYMGVAETLATAVDDALAHSIRITALLTKLRDSLDGEADNEVAGS